MNKLFWGFFFITLNFSLNFNGASINVLPNWAGYILLYLACGELLHESDLFQKPRGFCFILALIDGASWLLALVGLRSGGSIFAWLISAVFLALRLAVSYWIIDAIANTEVRRNAPLGSASLRRTWTVQAICAVAALALVFIPLLAGLAALAASIAAIVFLVSIHKSRKLYREMVDFYGG